MERVVVNTLRPVQQATLRAYKDRALQDFTNLQVIPWALGLYVA